MVSLEQHDLSKKTVSVHSVTSWVSFLFDVLFKYSKLPITRTFIGTKDTSSLSRGSRYREFTLDANPEIGAIYLR